MESDSARSTDWSIQMLLASTINELRSPGRYLEVRTQIVLMVVMMMMRLRRIKVVLKYGHTGLG